MVAIFRAGPVDGLQITAGGADAAQTMAVGALYLVDISGYTANRTYTLPATANVDDRCGIMLSAGDTTYELLITATAGDTLNGVAGGSEWSRLFITNEVVIFRCITANAAWIVERDGRIPQTATLRLSTDADGESATTLTRPTQAATPGAWTADIDVGGISSTSGDSITPRRAGNYLIMGAGRAKDGLTADQFWGCQIQKNGGTFLLMNFYSPVSTAAFVPMSPAIVPLAADDALVYLYQSQAGGHGADGTTFYSTWFSVREML